MLVTSDSCVCLNGSVNNSSDYHDSSHHLVIKHNVLLATANWDNTVINAHCTARTASL